ncbi:MAG TPA: Maf family protein [Limnobacter sp.]|uniref:Maf family protein n=1 Tax=Limnobacter sp. TaxID=2003368 RepID=UPI002E33C2BE|nr:Maf family protein [Limnobacter sp.]HEX5484516.1 Maf family protein [Limnobacter sp.]
MQVDTLPSGLPKSIRLASRSPRRRELLEQLGIQVQLLIAQTPEDAEALEALRPGEAPLDYVARVTRLKLDQGIFAMRQQNLNGWVLAADTTVDLHGEVLGKPETPLQAMQMLNRLQGTLHQVHTSVAVAFVQPKQVSPLIRQATQTSEVEFDHIPEEFAKAYVAAGTPFDKAGGYGIQSEIGQFVRRISGSYSGIMGLPVYETSMLLRDNNR